MIRAAALPMLFLVAAAGCVRRDGRNTDCHWPGEIAAKALKADQPGYGKHLSEDAEFAEDLAIRYTDAHHGPRSGHFESHEAAGRARNRCLTAMFGEVAKAHAVTPAEVFKFLGRNRGLIDLAVNLPFALLYGFAMSMIAGRILSRHRQGGGFGVVGLVLLGSCRRCTSRAAFTALRCGAFRRARSAIASGARMMS